MNISSTNDQILHLKINGETSKDMLTNLTKDGHIEGQQMGKASLVTEVGVQCELEIEAVVTPKFDIMDAVLRRRLVRNLFATLTNFQNQIQNCIVIPVIEAFLVCFAHPLPRIFYKSSYFGSLIIFGLLNIGSNKRRHPPMNYVGLVFTTILYAGVKGLQGNTINSQWALLYPTILIAQLLVLMAYTRLVNFKFTNMRGVLLVTIVFGIYLVATIFLASFSCFGITAFVTLEACYIVYDTQLMTSGHHGYKLQPEEHIFAAANIYVDMSRFIWGIIKLFVLNHIIELYHFIKKSCPAEVC